jgi:predicted dehydrogenase
VKTHYALAKEAMEAGKHVLIEKPMVRKSTEAQDLIHLAAQRDLVLMVGHTFEYNPAVVSLRDIVKSGQIGRTFTSMPRASISVSFALT